jgi:hypothetical protein
MPEKKLYSKLKKKQINNSMKILIAGGSWGCGEWGGNPPDYNLSHPGLEKYFRIKKC